MTGGEEKVGGGAGGAWGGGGGWRVEGVVVSWEGERGKEGGWFERRKGSLMGW